MESASKTSRASPTAPPSASARTSRKRGSSMRRIPASATPVFALLLAAACSAPVPAPVAVASATGDMTAGSFVQLDGTKSTDPQSREITYSWSFVSRPLGSNAQLIDANGAKPSFQADVPGTYELELKVSTTISSSTTRVTVNI